MRFGFRDMCFLESISNIRMCDSFGTVRLLGTPGEKRKRRMARVEERRKKNPGGRRVFFFLSFVSLEVRMG